MKRTIFTALCLALLIRAGQSSPTERALVAIDGPGPQTAAALLEEGVVVLRDLGGYLVALATPRDVETVARLGLECRVLDEAPSGKTFYIATPRTQPAIDHFGTDARVYHASGYGSVIEATPEQAQRLAGAGVEVARLFMTPMRAPRIDKPAPRVAPASADPLIAAMVDSVSIDRISNDVQRLQDFVTRYAFGDSVRSARDWVAARFASVGVDSVTLEEFIPSYSENVVAVKPGVGHPEKIVIVCGHYDSVTSNANDAPGADDNATGTSCVLECARLLAPHLFDYTLVFIAFCGEEQGLIGSEAYAAAAEARGDDIVAVINVDMIGYTKAGDATDLDIVSNASSQWLRDLLMDTAALYVPAFAVIDGSLPGTSSSDHASFWRHGFDAIMFWEDTNAWSPYIHGVNDLVGLSYNNPTLALGSVRVAVATLATLAAPFRVVVLHTPLENTEDTQGMYRVDAEILHADDLDPDSLQVRYTRTEYDLVGAVRTSSELVTTEHTAPLVRLGHSDSYQALIPPQLPGTIVDYYIVARDVNGFSGTDPRTAPADKYRFIVGTPTVMIADDFEAAGGWIAGAPGDDATAGFWERAVPVPVYQTGTVVVPDEDHTVAGENCFLTANAELGQTHSAADVDGGRTTLLSPVFNLSSMSNAWVSYYRWYSNDTAGNKDDVWRVDVSDDAGQSWVNLETLSDSQREWTRVERFLNEYITLSTAVRFRFVAEDANAPSAVEALVDDFAIVQYTGAVTTTHTGVPAVTLRQNYPNPFNPRTSIRFTVTPPGGPATLRVYDVAGRLVTTLVDHEVVSGERVVEWDGRDRFGGEVASGVYFYRLNTGAVRETRKMVVVR